MKWLADNAEWLVPLAINVLSTVATGLSDYPKADGAVKWIRLTIATLGWAQFRDGKGSLKPLGTLPTAQLVKPIKPRKG